MTTFFRLLNSSAHNKGADLLRQISTFNQGRAIEYVFHTNPNIFSTILGSPFAYWVDHILFALFRNFPSFDTKYQVRVGASTKDDFRFLRLFWEVNPNNVGRNKKWSPFAKGGSYSPFYSDVYLLILWEHEAKELSQYIVEKYPYLNTAGWVLHTENNYKSSGITFPRRPHRQGSFRAMPEMCIFADNGPCILADEPSLLPLLSIVNSQLFN